MRELQNTLTRAAIWSRGETIDTDELREALLDTPPGAKGTKESILDRSLPVKLGALVREVKGHYLERALQETHENVTKAAALVGINNYQTFKAWLRKIRDEG